MSGTGCSVSYSPAVAPQRRFQAVAAAVLLTVSTFLLLPCMEMLSRSSSDDLVRRSIEVTDLPPPPAPLPQRPLPDEARPPESTLPKPRLAAPRTKLPVSLAMNLDLALGATDGDFSLDFGIRPSSALARIDDGIFELFELDEAPRPLVRIQPFYPVQARMRQIEGAVMLEFVVDASGKARDIKVVSSTPGQVFAEAASQAVNRWRFSPGTRNGRPVAVRVRQKITFRLED